MPLNRNGALDISSRRDLAPGMICVFTLFGGRRPESEVVDLWLCCITTAFGDMS